MNAEASRVTADVTCLGCGCLCDDLVVTGQAGLVTDVRNACPIGLDWFAATQVEGASLPAAIEGKPSTLLEAVDRTVRILSGARAPLVTGLRETSVEAVREAVALAEAIRGRVVIERSSAESGALAAFQRQGRVSATLGEIKNRADVVVFWNIDPAVSHPRHLERYSALPVGRFVPEGRKGRTIIAVGSTLGVIKDEANLAIEIPEPDQLAALNALRLLIREDKGRYRTSIARSGLNLDQLVSIADLFKNAKYGALFFRPGPTLDDPAGSAWEAATRLVRDLNDSTRFVMLGPGAAGNLSGAEAVLTWQGGYPQGLDYTAGIPEPVNDLTTLDESLSAQSVDALVYLESSWPEGLSAGATSRLGTIPRVLIGPEATAIGSLSSTVAINTARVGFDAGGTVFRVDGISLPVRPVAVATRPSEAAVLRAIRNAIRGTLT